MRDGRVQDLSRQLRLFPATNIVVADMIGVGIFTTSGLLLGQLGSPVLMIVLWVGGGVLALCGALCYGELGAAIPRAGGEYVYLSKLFHPLLGFLTGWVSFFVGFSAPLALSSLGFSEYLGRAFPGLVGWGDPDLIKKVLAITVILILTLVHLRGMEFGSRVQNYLTVGKVLLIAGFVIVGFALGRGGFDNLQRGVEVQSDLAGWKTAGLSLMWITFAYTGWNASAYIGSEIRDPERNLPRSLILGTGLVMLLYICLNLLFVYAVEPVEMSGVIAVGGLAASELFGGAADTAISILIAFALLSAISALIILGPRVYYAMAKDGYFFKAVADVHPVYRVPSKSIVLQFLIAAVMVMSGTFDQILTYMGFGLGIFPIVAVIGVFKLRKAGSSTYRMPLYPVVPLLFICVSLLILVLAFLERPVESSIALATVGVGIPVYAVFSKVRRRTTETGESE
ncbi:MAG: amino acid permease [Gemmatimonadetes bacterium]|nr:amino acid permease [Gemmatimonadota bacterium]NIO31322.1 amino acid permease [Gemmatimonadota bacterium]